MKVNGIDRAEEFEYLDKLRVSGVTNMYCARPYLSEAFPELDKREALAVLQRWGETFSERRESGETVA